MYKLKIEFTQQIIASWIYHHCATMVYLDYTVLTQEYIVHSNWREELHAKQSGTILNCYKLIFGKKMCQNQCV